jgi:hypothetical protein
MDKAMQRLKVGRVWLQIVCLVAASLAVAEQWTVGGPENSWAAAGEMANLEEVDGWLQPLDISGLNLAATLFERDGWVEATHFSDANLRNGIDGFPDDGWGVRRLSRRLWNRSFVQIRDKQGNPITTDQFQDVTIILDLGGRFGVDSLSFFARESHLVTDENAPKEDWFIKSYQIFVDGGLQVFEVPERTVFGIWTSWRPFIENWNLVAQDVEVERFVGRVDLSIPLVPVRYLALNDFISLPDDVGWEIEEFEVWGRGYAMTAEYISEVIDLEDLSNLGSLRWSMSADPGADITIRTRTGTTTEPNIYHQKTGLGLTGQTPVTREQYRGLRSSQLGTIEFDAENWDFWSAPYSPGGDEPIVALGPRRAVQFKIEFNSFSPLARARVDSLSIEHSTSRVARQVVGELFPQRIEPGEVNTFQYALLAVLGAESTGFDAIRISTPVRVDPQAIARVAIDGVEMPFNSAADECGFTVFLEGTRVPQNAVQNVDSVRVDLEFSSRVFLHGTRFAGEVFDSQSAEIAQDVVPGDATSAFDSSDLRVEWPLNGRVLSSVGVRSRVLTPNGDGVNDLLRISYSLLQVTVETPVELEIFDLGGRGFLCGVWIR